VAYVVLRNLSQPAYFDKILVVPIMNLLAVRLDFLAERIFGRSAGKRTWITPGLGNRYCHLALYVVLFLTILPALKYRDLSAIDSFPPHSFYLSSEMLELGAKAVAFRAAYPDVCSRFGFLAEAAHFDDYGDQ